MATRIEDLENWVGGRFEEYGERLDPKYSDAISEFVHLDYEPLDDDTSVIKYFIFDRITGKLTSISIGLKKVKKRKPMTPEIINGIANLIRKLGYVDEPIEINPPYYLGIKAGKENKEFFFNLYKADSAVIGIPNFNFPIEMKDEIPGIVKVFYEYFSKK